MFKLKDFDKGEIISYGLMGTTYKVINKSTNNESDDVIMKVERFIPNNQSWYLENAFAFEMGSLYPQHFTQLYDYITTSKCDHIQQQPQSLDNIRSKYIKESNELAKSNWCIYRMYAKIDTTLKKMSDEKYNYPTKLLSTYSMLAQMFYIIERMQYHGWLHDDIHEDNIGVKYTDETHIELGDVVIPTFGKRYYVIDYGTVKHKIFSNPKPNPKSNDIKKLIKCFIRRNEFRNHIKTIPFNESIEKFKKLKSDVKINPPNDLILHYVIQFTQPEIFQKIVSPTTKEFYPDELLITKEDILFFAANWLNTPTLKHYFANKASQ